MDPNTSVALLLLLGLLAGILSGLVGIGGGIIVVPALIFILGYDQKLAQGTTLAMLLLPIGALGVWQYHLGGNVRWPTALLLAAGFVLGAYLGSRWAVGMPTLALKRVFGMVLLMVAIKMLGGFRLLGELLHWLRLI